MPLQQVHLNLLLNYMFLHQGLFYYFLCLLIEKGGRRSCKFSSLAESSSPIISGLVAKNCPSFINVVPIDSKELDNLSPSFVFKFLWIFLENEIESN